MPGEFIKNIRLHSVRSITLRSFVLGMIYKKCNMLSASNTEHLVFFMLVIDNE